MSAENVEGAQQNDNNAVIDIEQWLSDTNLGDEASDLIRKREVSIDELMEFSLEDLKKFATDLKLDTLAKNRFLSSIHKLREQKQNASMPYIPTGTSYVAKQHVIVSPAEHNAIIQLYETYDTASTLSNNIRASFHGLDDSESYVLKQIESEMDGIIESMKKKKETVLQQLDEMNNFKKQMLTEQLKFTQDYINVVSDGKKKWDQIIAQKSNLDINERKRLILSMTENVMNYNGVSMSLRTAPKMEFDVEKYSKNLLKLFDVFELNDCDQPRTMQLALYKVRDSEIAVTFELHKYDITSPKKVQQIVLEYAILDKSYSKLIPKKEKRKKKGKKGKKGLVELNVGKKSKDSDESDSSDSKSDSDSDTSSSNSSDDEKSDGSDDVNSMQIDSEINNIDINSLKWKENDGKIKYKKHKKRNKYLITNLKENRAYLIRIRAKNSSGFGPYSSIISAVTQKTQIKFDRCDPRYFVCENKGKRVRSSNNSCTYNCVFSSKGFSSGIKRWKIKTVTRKHGSTEAVGVVTQVFEGQQCYNKQITTCGGLSGGTGLTNGCITEVILDFHAKKVTFKRNGAVTSTQAIVKGQKYYPCIQSCACSGQMFELVK